MIGPRQSQRSNIWFSIAGVLDDGCDVHYIFFLIIVITSFFGHVSQIYMRHPASFNTWHAAKIYPVDIVT